MSLLPLLAPLGCRRARLPRRNPELRLAGGRERELRSRLPSEGPLALWATPACATAIGLVAALQAGMTVVPLDPRSGEAELRHILTVSRPTALLAAPGATIAGLPTISPRRGTARRAALKPTIGPPKAG